MSTKRIVPVAYVTKWAATKGILVVRGAEAVQRDGHDDAYLSKGFKLFVHPAHWTEDRAVAVALWRRALKNKRKSHEKAIAKIEKALAGEPPFTEGA